jgi:hypothetical protein
MQNIVAVERIATLLASYAVGQIMQEEQKELEAWTNENVENRLLFEKLTDANLIETAEIMRVLKVT